jgi:myo-inositol-1(or 4)-monophosphatase
VPELPTSVSGQSAADVARAAAEIAAQVTLPSFQALTPGNAMEKEIKGRGNWVTATDLACEEAVIKLLAVEYPAMPVLSEETSAAVEGWDKGWLWVMDPIDGTANFSRGIPSWAFNLALCHDGEPVLGLTYQPVTGDEFFAEKGKGLTVNGQPACVSEAPTLGEALMGIGLGYEYDRAKLMLGLLADVWPGIMMVQNIGTAALGLAYAASGRFDMYVHSTLYPWDMAPGIIQIREGGGEVIARDGSPISIYSEGLISGARGPVQEFLALTRERKWR